MATMADVARLAQVSKSTVSHVLNGTRPVHPDTERAVHAAIRKLAYTPNTIARSLARSKTNSIGVATTGVTNPYFGEILQAIDARCMEHGITMLSADTRDDPDHELSVVQALHERRVDGVILAPSPDPLNRTLSYLTERRVPTVLIDRVAVRQFDQVAVENVESMRGLVDHLVDHGHTRIGFIAGLDGLATTEERLTGYRLALARRNIEAEPDLVVNGQSAREAGRVAAERLLTLRHPPTAIISSNNQMTIGAMQAIRDAGRSVPDEIALVGYDDFEWAELFEPRLTVIALPCAELGQSAFRLLQERLADPDREPITLRLRPELRVRNSCGCHS